MNPNDEVQDRVAAALADLQAHDVGPVRAAQIRARCRAVLAGDARHRGEARAAREHSRAAERAGLRAPRWRRLLEPALVAGLSVVFLAEVISRALRLEGF